MAEISTDTPDPVDAPTLAEAIERDPDRVDPVLAGTTGLAFLEHIASETDHSDDLVEEAAELAVRLLDFAANRAADHPMEPTWRYHAAWVLADLADQRESPAELDEALARVAAVALDRAAPPDLAEDAAVDTAKLTARRLAMAVGVDEDLASDEVRRATDVVAGVKSIVRTARGGVDFLVHESCVHRWAFIHTGDPADLDRVVSGLNVALRSLPPHDDIRPIALETLAAAHEERYQLSDDPAHLASAIATVDELRSLLPDDDPRLTWTRTVRARLAAARFWTAPEARDGDRDEAIATYAALFADTGLDVHHALEYGYLLSVRGRTTEDVGDLVTGIDVLAEIAEDRNAWDWPMTSVLTDAYEAMAALDGPHHHWAVIDWSTRALGFADSGSDESLRAQIVRLDAIEAAATEFGIGDVLARHDVRQVLAEAGFSVRSHPGLDPAERARLTIRTVMVTTRWLEEFVPVGNADAARETVRTQLDLLAEVKDGLGEDDRVAFDAVAAIVAAIAGSYGEPSSGDPDGGGPLAGLNRLLPLLDRLPDTATETPEDEAAYAAAAAVRRVLRQISDSADFHESTGQITALAWQVDALPPSDQRAHLTMVVSVLCRMFGPPSLTPLAASLPRPVDASGVELVGLLTMADTWRAAMADGDPQQALWAYQAIERTTGNAEPGTALDLTSRLARGISRAQLSALVVTDAAALDTSIATLERSWAENAVARAAIDLGSRLRLRDRPGDRERSRGLGLAALIAEARQVSLMSIEDGVAQVAQVRAIEENVTAWCLDDDSGDDLVRVLEARRALVLGAATGEQVPAADVATVRTALRAVDANVLAYLVPESATHNGMAVLVPVTGPVRVVPLPELRDGCVTGYGTAAGAQRGAAPGSAAERTWRTALTDVCRWAWEVAGAELVLAAGGGPIVLVPLGMLGLVPWAAAWRTVDGRRRYLVEDVEISVVPAASLLGRSAGHPPQATGAAVFVGNPDRTDAAAGTSAESLRTVFHPDGRFLGGHGQAPRPWRAASDGAGTPDEIRKALSGGLSVLHLGCPAESDTAAPHRSRIVLHGASLTAADLLAAPADLGLVTMAGHAPIGIGDAYDEAATLAAAFLAIGARSVLATRWSAPTDCLMHLVHHHIAENGSSPRAALRAAQLWMLDPDRALPPGAPACPADPAAIWNWAVLTHLGV